jgi:hypothetical protein
MLHGHFRQTTMALPTRVEYMPTMHRWQLTSSDGDVCALRRDHRCTIRGLELGTPGSWIDLDGCCITQQSLNVGSSKQTNATVCKTLEAHATLSAASLSSIHLSAHTAAQLHSPSMQQGPADSIQACGLVLSMPRPM